jgi:hypothetical protein
VLQGHAWHIVFIQTCLSQVTLVEFGDRYVILICIYLIFGNSVLCKHSLSLL